MCVFCSAVPVVVGASMVAQDKQRKKLERAESKGSSETQKVRRVVSPKLILTGGMLTVVGVFIAAALYHTHYVG